LKKKLILLCMLAAGFSGIVCLGATEEQPASPAWGGQKVKRVYSSEKAQALFEQQVLERSAEGEEELETQPLLDSSGGGEISEDDYQQQGLKRTRPIHSKKSKKYGYQEPEQDPSTQQAPRRPVLFQEVVVETDLETEPMVDSREQIEQLHTLEARLDRSETHLDESFTLILEIMVSDINALHPIQLPPMADLNLINTYASDSSAVLNGKIWSVRTVQYVFVARRTGAHQIPAIMIHFDGKKYFTEKTSIEVKGTRSGIRYYGPLSGKAYQIDEIIESAPDVGKARKDEVDITAGINREKSYVNQQVILTVQLKYSLDKHTDMSYRPPQLTGFITEELPEAKTEERISGEKKSDIDRRYRTALFPVRHGKVVVDVAEAVFVRKRQKRSFLTESIVLQVLPLPEDVRGFIPADRRGLVGQFDMTARLDKDTAEVDAPIRLTLTLRGKGNLSSVPEPVISRAEDFRVYLENKNVAIETTGEGVSGEKLFTYLVIFDKPGQADLGHAIIRFFNPDREVWESAIAKIPVVQVAPRPFKEIEVISEDPQIIPLELRPNHGGAAVLKKPVHWAVVKLSFWLFQGIGLLLIALILVGRRLYKQALKDAEVIRIRKAYAGAKKSLRRLKRLMHRQADKEFYNGLAKTASEYLSLKFESPNVYIGVESMPDYFEHFGIPEVLHTRFKAALTACEYVRYAAAVLPNRDKQALYRDVKNAIRDFEKYWVARNRKKAHRLNPTVAAILLLSTGLGAAGPALAGDEEVRFWRANTYAENNDLAKAEGEYKQVLAMGVEDADVYYNLGNTYLRQGKTGLAIMAYERGLKIRPRDKDLKYNLYQAEEQVYLQNALPRKRGPGTRFFTIYRSLTPNELIGSASASYFIAVIFLVLLLLWPVRLQRLRLLMWVAAVFAVLCTGWSITRQYESRWFKQGVVMTKTTEIFSRPYANADMLYTIPEGMRVQVKREEEAWVEVFFEPHRHGWVQRATLSFIE